MPRPDGKPSLELATARLAARARSRRGYFGPKDVSILESYGLGLERTVDFGWYGILARPLLWLMKKTYAVVRNWGVAILRRDLPHPAAALPADGQELHVDEEDAEARAEDERDPGQVQEGQDRRGAAPEDEHGADGAVPERGLQPDERLPPGAAAAADPRRVLQRPLEARSSCGTRRSSSGSRTSRRSTAATCSSS